MAPPASAPAVARRSRVKTSFMVSAVLVTFYAVVAYVLLPWGWIHYERQSGLAGLPMVTRTAQDIPGDPLNVGLVGSREDVVWAMQSAGWSPADPITLKTSLEIAGSVLLDRPYRDAPVSPLFYQGRREDLAYEKEVGSSADRRHHVRFWKAMDSGSENRPVWLGCDFRSRRGPEPVHGTDHTPYRTGYRCRTRRAGRRSRRGPDGFDALRGFGSRADAVWPQR